MFEKAIVVGSGPGGATIARELHGKYIVTILEAGGAFYPFSSNFSNLELMKKTGMFLSEWQFKFIFPGMKIRKIKPDNILALTGISAGGTSTLSAGCALRADRELQNLGIHLNPEFNELFAEIPVNTKHTERWNPATKKLYETCAEMGFNPEPTPRMAIDLLCSRCGHCVLGCNKGAKWDSRQFLRQAVDIGAKLISWASVEKVVIKNNKAVGVEAKVGWTTKFFPADLVVLAAGGLNTPLILKNSGIECDHTLFLNPTICFAAEMKNCNQHNEIPLPFIFRNNDSPNNERFIIAPYFDPLSFFFDSKWKYHQKNIISLMIKIIDTPDGTITDKKIDKIISDHDKTRMLEAMEICSEIFAKLGIERKHTFTGITNAWEPGGMLPINQNSAHTLHDERLPENLYIADSTILPPGDGNPPMMTIMALAKRIAKHCLAKIR